MKPENYRGGNSPQMGNVIKKLKKKKPSEISDNIHNRVCQMAESHFIQDYLNYHMLW